MLLAIPAFLDFISALLHYIALNFIPGSIYQMMRGGTIITTFIFSVTMLRSKIKNNKFIGSILVLFGILIVGASNILFSKAN